MTGGEPEPEDVQGLRYVQAAQVEGEREGDQDAVLGAAQDRYEAATDEVRRPHGVLTYESLVQEMRELRLRMPFVVVHADDASRIRDMLTHVPVRVIVDQYDVVAPGTMIFGDPGKLPSPDFAMRLDTMTSVW